MSLPFRAPETKRHRGRSVATLSILVAAGGALAMLPFRAHPLGAAGFALFEAALVGGFADWFAVTALFRHPLGQKWVPHTAIIPANRDRIIDNLVALVENRLLNQESLQRRLSSTPIALPLLDAIEDQETLRNAAGFLARGISARLREEPLDTLSGLIETSLKRRILEREAPLLWQDLRRDWLGPQRFELWAGAGLRGLSRLPSGPTLRTTIRSTLEGMIEKFLDGNPFASLARGFLDEEKLTQLVVEGLKSRLLQAAENEADPLRAALRKACDPDEPHAGLLKILETLQQGLRETDPSLADRLARSARDAGAAWLESEEGHKQVQAWLAGALRRLRDNPEHLGRLDVYLRSRLLILAEKHHDKIGEVVRENLQVLSARQFSDELEDRVGQDLQWIRVNGAVVGGLVGLILHLLLKLV